MNILAHLILGWPNEGAIVGNFLADQVRGGRFEGLPEEVAFGVKMHRQIDVFTDAHPATRRSTARLRAHIGRFAPVAIDVVYDHFLARDFETYTKAVSLQPPANELVGYVAFAENVLTESRHLFTPSTQGLFDAMVKHQWLTNYANWDGIERVLYGMSRRTKFPSRLEEAAESAFAELEWYEYDFQELWSDLLTEFRGVVN